MKKLICCLVLVVCFLLSGAQVIQHARKVNAFGDKEAADSLDVYCILNGNIPGDFQTSGVPYATVVGKDGKFIIGAGGFVKGVLGWDIGHPIPNADEFITSQIPVGDMDGDGSRFNLSARQTHLFINFVALPGGANQIGAFIGANFLSDSYMPVLQYAYLKYRGFTLGYDNTLFSDPSCGPPAVDYEGPCSNTCSPIATFNYKWKHGKWMFGAGLELPQTSFTTVEGKTKSVYQRAPDIPLAAMFSWGGGNSRIRTSAIFRTLTYRSYNPSGMGKNHSRLGFGFQASGAWQFLNKLTLYYQGVWGKGIGSVVQDTAGEGLDMTPTDDNEKLSPVMLWGGFLALRYDISSRFASSVTYSQLRTYANEYKGGTTPWGDLYKYAQYVSTNLFFELTSYIELGIEHIWGRRTNYDGSRGADNRIQTSFQLTF